MARTMTFDRRDLHALSDEQWSDLMRLLIEDVDDPADREIEEASLAYAQRGEKTAADRDAGRV
jgi:hypothetical protein